MGTLKVTYFAYFFWVNSTDRKKRLIYKTIIRITASIKMSLLYIFKRYDIHMSNDNLTRHQKGVYYIWTSYSKPALKDYLLFHSSNSVVEFTLTEIC
jgi:hypothetical protein